MYFSCCSSVILHVLQYCMLSNAAFSSLYCIWNEICSPVQLPSVQFSMNVSSYSLKNCATFLKNQIQNQTNSDRITCVFPGCKQLTCFGLEFSFVPWDVFLGSEWLLWYLWFWFCDITWNDLWLLTLYARNPEVFSWSTLKSTEHEKCIMANWN